MTKIYEIGIKKTIYGFRQIRAENEDEAKKQIEKEINQNEDIEMFEDDNQTEIISVNNYEENN